jgi:hypothetical protein
MLAIISLVVGVLVLARVASGLSSALSGRTIVVPRRRR